MFSEDDFDIGQNWQENIYVKGKFLAEQKVRKEIEAGLDAKIFRVGRLVGRSTDGVFQKNPETNAFYRLLQGPSEAGRDTGVGDERAGRAYRRGFVREGRRRFAEWSENGLSFV